MNIDTENGEPVIIDIEYGDRIQMPSVPSRNESPADCMQCLSKTR